MIMKKLKKLEFKQLKIQHLLALGVLFLILGVAAMPLVFAPTGEVSGGFMKDGERMSSFLPLAFVDPAGNPVDAVWIELSWTVEGTNVDWTTFTIAGEYGIKLWYMPSDPILLVERTFELGGEARALTNTKIEWDYLLTELLAGQPHTDPSDPTFWMLIFYGSFTMSVASAETGDLLYDSWDGETPMLRVNWIDPATFSGYGSVSTATVSV